jgi:hypothetical protein
MSTDFDPALHGFHFPNSFVNNVASIPFVGTITTYGLCGGMSFKALDYYLGSTPIPTHRHGDFGPGLKCPPQGTVLYQDIYDRHMETINPITTPSATKFVFGVSYQETVDDEWPLIVAKIDAGEPCPVGLISSVGLTKCHQVVAIGYSSTPTKQIHIYDCNHPDTSVTLTLDDGARLVSESTGESWVGLFMMEYSVGSADYLDIVMSAPLTTNPSPPWLANPAEVGFTVQNAGEFPAHIASLDVYTRGPAGENLDSMFVDDGGSSTLPPTAVRNYNAATDYFGTTGGSYTLVGYYQTMQGYWVPVPSNGGPSGSTDVFVA